MSLVCITNDMHDLRPCTIKGQHQIDCDGWAYRWNEKHQRLEATGRPCHGCQPREARHGLLCWTCWESVQTAVGGYERLATLLTGIDRAVQRDNGGIRGQSLGYVPIPGVPLALEELESYIRDRHASVDVWVSNPDGAKNAVRFGRAYASALRSHPPEEVAHKINRTRCPACNRISLVWNPPVADGAEVTVICQNPECGQQLAQSSFETIAAIEKPDLTIAVIIDAGQPRNLTGAFAEPFDPTNPDHRALIEESA